MSVPHWLVGELGLSDLVRILVHKKLASRLHARWCGCSIKLDSGLGLSNLIAKSSMMEVHLVKY